ncbi:MAG TPA: CD225/dispanin family protein [Polyangiaceae bacterium]|nr:CD225/dispanin family protein [Polyangiaceae bacterium]
MTPTDTSLAPPSTRAAGFGPPAGGGAAPPPGGYGAPPPGGYGAPPPGGYGAPPPGGYGAPPPGGYGGPPGSGGAPPGGPLMPGAGGDINTTLPLVLSVLSLFCCGLGTVLGIIGVVLSVQASNAKNRGDLESARGKAKMAVILASVGIALGLLGGVVSALAG